MRRIWFGAALLAALLLLGIGVSIFMKQTHNPGSECLKQAASLAQEDHWPEARTQFANAREKWQKKWHVTASVADHEPMDQVDALFAELAVYAQQEDILAFCGGCAHLAKLLESFADSNALSWWNLL